jgi:hypothetical protein
MWVFVRCMEQVCHRVGPFDHSEGGSEFIHGSWDQT